jgi:hypothetical protein
MNETRKGLAAIGMATRDVALPDATGRDLTRQLLRFQQTEPSGLPSRPASTRPAGATGRPGISSPRSCPAGPCDTALPGVTGCDTVRQKTSFEKTNPNPSDPRLSVRQLAAVRLALQGLGSADIASRLGTTRQTVHRWTLLPAFIAELHRMHELIVVAKNR